MITKIIASSQQRSMHLRVANHLHHERKKNEHIVQKVQQSQAKAKQQTQK